MPSQFIELIFAICESNPTPSLKFHFPSDNPNLVNMLVNDDIFAAMLMDENTGCFTVATRNYGNFQLDYAESAALMLGMVESAQNVNFSKEDRKIFQDVRDSLGVELEHQHLDSLARRARTDMFGLIRLN